MKGLGVLTLRVMPNEETMQTVAELNSVLEKMGGSIRFEQDVTIGRDTCDFLTINFDIDKANEYLSRGAGRSRKIATEWLTVGEVRQMLTEDTAENVAKKLGVSRSTLFRRLKTMEDEFYF